MNLALFDWLGQFLESLRAFAWGLISTDNNLDSTKLFAALALVISALALLRAWNWKPKPRLRFRTDWHEGDPREQGGYEVYVYELINVGGVSALDVEVTLNKKLDGAGGSLRAFVRPNPRDLRVSKGSLASGESLYFTVHFQRQPMESNPKNAWARFDSEDLILTATYLVPPLSRVRHKIKHGIDDDVAQIPGG